MGQRAILATIVALGAGCMPDGEVVAVADAGDAAATDLGRVDDAVPVERDDAVIVRATFPEQLACGGAGSATVIVRNTGTTTWTRAGAYRLGAIDGDPRHPGVALLDGEAVPPSATHTFVIGLVAPANAGPYMIDWRMVRGATGWFGEASTARVRSTCAPADAGAPDVPRSAPSVDLAAATVLNSPADVAAWPATATITRLELSRTGVRIDFTRRDGPDSWPDVPFVTPGENLQYTLWIVLNLGGRWYTSGCLQYWRGLDRMGGPPSEYAMNWYYDPNRWRPMTGHQPAAGEYVGFFVTAGNARNVTDGSGSVVRERSNVVVVPFPTDDGATFTY